MTGSRIPANEALWQAVVLEDYDEAEEIIATRKPNLNKAHIGETLLSKTVHKGDEQMMRLLLDKGADINGCDDGSKSPLTAAIHMGRHGLLRFLLDKGANPDQPDGKDLLPLTAAVLKRDLDAIGLLLHYGADIEAADSWGKTALDVARDWPGNRDPEIGALMKGYEIHRDRYASRIQEAFEKGSAQPVIPMKPLTLVPKRVQPAKIRRKENPAPL
ncbi:MAG: ankyrin repeat domain-containing protein [Alphaproteobacteria bacterium]|nr:MAG: ankyrin repeat domain-containing protein [Alphaproteobacteria bacterium]